MLPEIALAGWRLFDKITPEEGRDDLEKLLAPDEQIIHIAQILREKVIPWGVLYDRPYDKNKKKDADGKPVGFAVCTGSLAGDPAAGGGCFENSKCILHGHPTERVTDNMGRTLLPETVVCPASFLGFRHIIEVPPQQVDSDQKARPMASAIDTTGARQLLAAANCTLDLEPVHLKDIGKLL